MSGKRLVLGIAWALIVATLIASVVNYLDAPPWFTVAVWALAYLIMGRDVLATVYLHEEVRPVHHDGDDPFKVGG